MNSEKKSKSAWWVWPGRDASEYFLFMKGNNRSRGGLGFRLAKCAFSLLKQKMTPIHFL